jgi:hypothetical protein
MWRRVDDPLLAAGPLVAALAAAVHPLVVPAGALLLALVVLIARRRRPRPSGAPVIALAALEPRRPQPLPAISVASIARTEPAVRPLAVAGLSGHRIRRAPFATRGVDAAVLGACWDVATRGNARLTDAAAVRLGLADAPLPPAVGIADPDPLLLAAVSPLAA